jgi:hypothetical protein
VLHKAAFGKKIWLHHNKSTLIQGQPYVNLHRAALVHCLSGSFPPDIHTLSPYFSTFPYVSIGKSAEDGVGFLTREWRPFIILTALLTGYR